MGQYYRLFNLDKKQIFAIGALNGAKLGEICDNNSMGLVGLLLRQSTEFGGGDYNFDNKDIYEYNKKALVGSWAGDRIALIGDYDESEIYDDAHKFKDITDDLIALWNRIAPEEERYRFDYVWKKNSKVRMRPDFVF